MTAIKDFVGKVNQPFTSFWKLPHRLLSVQLHAPDGQVPMSVEDFKAPLLFLRICGLVGPKVLLQRVLVEGLVRGRRVLEYDGHAIIPASVFSRMVARLVHPD